MARRSRIGAAFVVLGALVGCVEDSGLLTLGDGDDGGLAHDGAVSAPDSSADAGLTDGRAPDATPGALDAGTTTAPYCSDGPGFLLSYRGFPNSFYEGRLVMEPGTTLELRDPEGPGRITVGGPSPQRLQGESVFWAQVDATSYFRVDQTRLALWYLEPDGSVGDIALLAWSGQTFREDGAEGASYHYFPADCEPRSSRDCGRLRGEILSVRVGDDVAGVPLGYKTVRPTYDAFNGRSQRFETGPTCPGEPAQWHEGWIAIDRAVDVDCAALSRDACIASSDCILWGSLDRDPGYVCEPATDPCERLPDRAACDTQARVCAWDDGDCYCPENVDCDCGGGPAPKCRSRCAYTYGDCAPDRYCVMRDVAPPECADTPTPPGICERRPRTCEGVPAAPVCACGPEGPQTFEHDCARRQAGGGEAQEGACP